MFLGPEDKATFLMANEDVFRWLPSGYRLLLQNGRLRVLSTYQGCCKMDFHNDENQPYGICKLHSEIEIDGPWQEVQGDGIAFMLAKVVVDRKGTGYNVTDVRFVAFFNRDTGRHFENPYPTAGLTTAQTDHMVERKGLLGSKKVPYSHTDESLRKLIRDIVDLCYEKYFKAFNQYYQEFIAYERGGSGDRL